MEYSSFFGISTNSNCSKVELVLCSTKSKYMLRDLLQLIHDFVLRIHACFNIERSHLEANEVSTQDVQGVQSGCQMM
jgi:hypothetical protein